MFYHLAQYLHKQWTFFNLFHYVSVRAMCALLTSIIFAFVFGNWFIRTSSKNFRSKVREWTPSSHQEKNNTPTMGGLFVIMVVFMTSFLWCNLSNLNVWLFLVCFVGFGAIGFVDDWLKIRHHKGIFARTKMLLQVSLATIIALAWYFLSHPDTRLCVPFVKTFMPDLWLLLIPWAVFIIVAMSNAVNLTDGLDGLATGPLIFNFGTFSLIAYLAGHMKFAKYLYIPYAGSAEIVVIGAALVGSLLGFLWYNTHPAQIFMGDVGSLAFGAALALMALMARQELLLLISGGIFVLETVSVILQVLSFRYLGKRLFRMAPIHHHFELLGWKEAKITVRFWIISIILCMIAFLTLKIR
ncbi:MAG: phospho-N-acetylmuramoyl-pentapeptide-transferase [bacterium]